MIIPTLNEATALPGLLQDLAAQQGVALEIVVADGGSRDATHRAVWQHDQVRWLTTPPGRGRQMNAGARASHAPLLLFLHADSRLSHPRQLAAALALWRESALALGHERLAGHFALRFVEEPGAGPLPTPPSHYRFHQAKSAINRPGCFNGDQGLLLSRAFFRTLGTFDTTLPFLEDRRLAERIPLLGEWITLPGHLLTSARRFQREGYHQRTLLNALLVMAEGVGLAGFLHHAPGLYRQQGETRGPLRLTPFFQLLHQEIWADGVIVGLAHWYRAGRLIRHAAWQPFLWLDAGREQRPWYQPPHMLRLYDAFLKPLLALPPCDLVATLLGVVWFHRRWRQLARQEGEPPP